MFDGKSAGLESEMSCDPYDSHDPNNHWGGMCFGDITIKICQHPQAPIVPQVIEMVNEIICLMLKLSNFMINSQLSIKALKSLATSHFFEKDIQIF